MYVEVLTNIYNEPQLALNFNVLLRKYVSPTIY